MTDDERRRGLLVAATADSIGSVTTFNRGIEVRRRPGAPASRARVARSIDSHGCQGMA